MTHFTGCRQKTDFADISDPDDRYINQPGKGPSFHTEEFMSGYDDCSIGSSNSNSGNDDY